MSSVSDNTGTLKMTVDNIIVYAAKSICTVSEDGTNVSVRYSPTQQFVYSAASFTAPTGSAATIAAAIAAMITSGGGGGGGGTSTTAQEGIIANPGGGQPSATSCTKAYNFIDTAASDGDSIKALTATNTGTAAVFQYFQNNTTKSINLFPQTGDAFYGQSANTALAIPPGGQQTIVCATTGTYRYF